MDQIVSYPGRDRRNLIHVLDPRKFHSINPRQVIKLSVTLHTTMFFYSEQFLGYSLQFKTDSSKTDDNYPFRPLIAVNLTMNVNFGITTLIC